MGKRPSFQFYPGDWLRDPAVRSVSFAAKGLWTDMLCLMFENDRKGFLQLNGQPVTAEQLARMTGGSPDEVARLLTELETSGVFSRTDLGVIYSRRMSRDEHIRLVRSQAGRQGARFGHLGGRPRRSEPANTPNLQGETAKTAKQTAKKPLRGGQTKGQNNPPSSSSSSSSLREEEFSSLRSENSSSLRSEETVSAEVGCAASAPPVLTFPTNGTGPPEWHLTEAKLTEYRESFPGVDVLAECRKALQWCRDNSRKRKTAHGMPAFLSRWLSKAQDKVGRVPDKPSRAEQMKAAFDEWRASHDHP